MADPARHVLRVALVYGDTVLDERQFDPRARVSVGHAPASTFILPTPAPGKRGRLVLLDGARLHLVPGLYGRLHVGGQVQEIEDLRAQGVAEVPLAPEDWGMLQLQDTPGVRILVQVVPKEALPAMPREAVDRPVLLTTALSALTFGVLMMVAFLRYDPDRPPLEASEISERMARVMFNEPPPPEEEPEPEVSDKDQDEEKARKRAGGDEGKFGRPDRKGPSNIPKTADEVAANTGLVKELNQLADSNTMSDLLGVSGQVGAAMGGLDDGDLVVGAGNFGMSTKGGGAGGGGEGEGMIHGTADVNTGGAGSANRKRTVKGAKRPKEKKVSVRTGRATVKGQLSKELIDREVRRHRAQITFCYNKQLLRHPDLSGKVVLRWIITMDGSVRGAKVKSSSLGNKDAESCMVRALESWRFPKPEGGVVQVDYPFLFGTK